jgi:cellulose synthase/poly-beta-1,6-N-acetylglucosamine synthase-like glycosyltransferase
LARASGEVIAFTDADCIPALDWIEQGLRALASDIKVGVAAGRVELVPAEPGELDSAAFLYEQLFAFRQEEAARSGHSVTANWMSPRSVFEEVGLFDANVKSGGDWLLSGRISAAGLLVRYVPEMVVRHPARGNLQELVAKRRRVVGGAWDRNGRGGRMRLITAVAADTFRKTRRAWLETKLGFADRVRILMVLWMLSSAAVLEVVRLSLGHEPRR